MCVNVPGSSFGPVTSRGTVMDYDKACFMKLTPRRVGRATEGVFLFFSQPKTGVCYPRMAWKPSQMS